MALKREFDHCAAVYAASRPAHAPEALAFIESHTGPPAGRVAFDVGAGTGLFTWGLADAGWWVVAVDASPVMLAQMSPSDHPVQRLCATAERLPFADGPADLVTVAQAFHWFNPPYALAEFARVLKRGAWLALLWYRRQVSGHPFVQDFEAVLGEFNPKYRGEFARQDWAGKIEACGAFLPAVEAQFSHQWQVDQEAVVGYGRSLSYIRNTVPRAELPRFDERVRSIARKHFGEAPCRIPLQTELWMAQKR
jgi:SAM-dependent methyltransferase